MHPDSEAFDYFVGECQLLGRNFSTYSALFSSGENRISLLNRTAPQLFNEIKSSLYHLFWLRFSRILDRDKTGNDWNISFARFYGILERDAFDLSALQNQKEVLDTVSAKLKKYRNKSIAHNDERAIVGGPLQLNLPDGATEQGIQALQEFIDIADPHFGFTTRVCRLVRPRPNHADDFFIYLQSIDFEDEALRKSISNSQLLNTLNGLSPK